MDSYKGSQFNLFIPVDDSEEEYLIFNTLLGSEVVVDKHLAALIERGRSSKGPSSQSLSPSDRSNLEQLRELGIIVDEYVDEERELEYWFQRIKFDTSILAVTILPTLACNLRCSYCLQDDLKATDLSMDQETCLLVAAWVQKKMEEIRPRILNIVYYGGEPLLRLPTIYNLSRTLHEAALAKGITLEIQIVTNGVLLTEELVDSLLPLGLSGIKITLDGDEEAHNRKRPFKGGGGSFTQILNNLIRISGRVPVRIGGNFDEENKTSIPALLDRLLRAGLQDKIEQVHFKPIFTSLARRKKNLAGGLCQICTFSEVSPKDILWLRKEIEIRGFKPNQGIALGPCSVFREHSYTIDPGGRIYKCGGFAGIEEFAVGDIRTETFNYRMTEFMTADIWKQCRGCAYIPLCGGGCRYSAFLKGGDFLKPACERRYFEQVAIPLIREEYVRSFG
ncbi:MAG: SPASM domain-containing protein [bacterium]|nr:SPASM domain-containing protein [bacterium]